MSNQQVQEVNTVKGAEAVARHLLRNEPMRLEHTLGVVENISLMLKADKVDEDFQSLCLQAAYLHDVGYSKDITFTHFHPCDGAYYLKKHDWRPEVVYAVMNHTFARDLMLRTRRELRIPFYQIESPVRGAILTEFITLADLHTLPDGDYTSVEGRIQDIANRYGVDSPLVAHLNNHRQDIANLMMRWSDEMLCLERRG